MYVEAGRRRWHWGSGLGKSCASRRLVKEKKGKKSGGDSVGERTTTAPVTIADGLAERRRYGFQIKYGKDVGGREGRQRRPRRGRRRLTAAVPTTALRSKRQVGGVSKRKRREQKREREEKEKE
ncbi:hypothetical protein V6Z11_A05G328400 [Gossypium hirsutum]